MARIFLVDDDDLLRDLLASALRLDGHDVSAAENGAQALEKMSHECGAEDCFDLIILDMQMPRMDGRKFLQALDPGRRRVIVFSALPVADMAELGVERVIRKPAALQDVMTAVREVLNATAGP